MSKNSVKNFEVTEVLLKRLNDGLYSGIDLGDLIRAIPKSKFVKGYMKEVVDEIIKDMTDRVVKTYDLYDAIKSHIIVGFETLFKEYIFVNYKWNHDEDSIDSICTDDYDSDLGDDFGEVFHAVLEKIENNLKALGLRVLHYDDKYIINGRERRIDDCIGVINDINIKSYEADIKIDKFWENHDLLLNYAKVRMEIENRYTDWRECFELQSRRNRSYTLDGKNNFSRKLFNYFMGEEVNLTPEDITEIEFIINFKKN